ALRRRPVLRGGASQDRFFFSSRRRHTSWPRDWSSDVCSSDLSLVARLRAILLRSAPPKPAAPRRVQGDLAMDIERHEVFLDGREVRLTPIEYKLLQALMEFAGRVFTRDQLLAHVYAFDVAVVVDRTIDVHIGKLREKLGDDPVRSRYIQTVRGVGYKFVERDRAG